MTRRSDLFPPDRGLQARMLVALLIAFALVVGVVLGLLWMTQGSWHQQLVGWNCVAFAGFGWLMGLYYLPPAVERLMDSSVWYLDVTEDQQARLEGSVQRLCVLADMSPPLCSAHPFFLPQSYTVAKPWRQPTLYVTAGMLRALDDRELDAVVAHELSHISNRDAVLMTVLTTPASWLYGRVWDMWRVRHEDLVAGAVSVATAVMFLPAVMLLAPVGLALTASSRVVSRHRELYADRCAALLTGSRAGVATTLLKISKARGGLRLPDLRTVLARDEYHILPDRPQPTGLGRVWATHPTVPARTAALGEMEGELQQARLRAEVSADG